MSSVIPALQAFLKEDVVKFVSLAFGLFFVVYFVAKNAESGSAGGAKVSEVVNVVPTAVGAGDAAQPKRRKSVAAAPAPSPARTASPAPAKRGRAAKSPAASKSPSPSPASRKRGGSGGRAGSKGASKRR